MTDSIARAEAIRGALDALKSTKARWAWLTPELIYVWDVVDEACREHAVKVEERHGG